VARTTGFTAAGWGVLQLQLTFAGCEVSARIAVNSEERALAWAHTYTELGDSLRWAGQLVGKRARRLIRVLKKPAG
jgi:hypothetical protein